MTLEIDEVPGLKLALEREAFLRDAAFLPVNESIAGFEAVPMTLREYGLLRLMKSPLLAFTLPTPVQLTQFLWFLSPQYTPVNGKTKQRFLRRCRRYFHPPATPWTRIKFLRRRWERKTLKQLKAFSDVVACARHYVADTFQDRPGNPMGVEVEPDYYSDAASLCGMIAREYGWKESDILGLPIKRLFQYLNEIKNAHGSQAFFAPSDRLKLEWARSQN